MVYALKLKRWQGLGIKEIRAYCTINTNASHWSFRCAVISRLVAHTNDC